MRKRRLLYLGIALVLLVASLILRIGFFAYAFYAAVLVALIAYLMAHMSLDGLATDRHCTLRRAEMGEEAIVTVGVRNQSPFFLPWVIMEDLLSPGLSLVQGASARASVMPPKGAATLRYKVRCARRGYHRVGPVLFESGDFFGLTRRFCSGPQTHFITVYPRVVPVDRYSVPSHRPLGETTAQMRLFEDPTRIAGVREYQHGDPLRRVHWKASARTGVLHAKIYDPSCLQGGNIVLDFNAASWAGEHARRRSELAVTIAASLAAHLAERGVDLGFVSNGVDAADVIETNPISMEAMNRDEARRLVEGRKSTDRLRPVQVKVRRGGETLVHIMEALARLELSNGLDLAATIAGQYHAWPREDTVILVVPQVTSELSSEIVRLKNSNFSVLVLLVDNAEGAPALHAGLANLGVHFLHLRNEADLHSIVI